MPQRRELRLRPSERRIGPRRRRAKASWFILQHTHESFVERPPHSTAS
jgi:hypothetical protein